ncbi:MAG: winged helix-turn-helix domain-containing protein [Piscinibacter sp.]
MHFHLLTLDDGHARALNDALRAAGHEVTRLHALPEPLPRADALLADPALLLHHVAGAPDRWMRLVTAMPVLLAGEACADLPGAEQIDAGSEVALIAERLMALGTASAQRSGERWLDGELIIDRVRETVLLDGRPVDLTPIEWRVVAALSAHAARAVPRAEIARLIGGDAGEASDNAVAVHLYNLRRKLGRHAIETIRGRGFRLRP